MTNLEIVERALSLKNVKYWYGAKGQTATKELADTLRKQNPRIWNDKYYEKAMKDLGKKVGDCSYLVCYSYNRPQIGSSQISAAYKKTDTPSKGMILWKKGHVGIYSTDDNGKGIVIELAGIDNDFRIRPYYKSQWQAILYDQNVDYIDYNKGWHKDKNGFWYAYGTHKGEYLKNKVISIPCVCTFDENGYLVEMR